MYALYTDNMSSNFPTVVTTEGGPREHWTGFTVFTEKDTPPEVTDTIPNRISFNAQVYEGRKQPQQSRRTSEHITFPLVEPR